MTKAVLLRVGIDSGRGGIQGPLFKNGSFEFVCIPDNKRVSVHKYACILVSLTGGAPVGDQRLISGILSG